MRKQPYSIFNDIIGPVMTGPSSSHTAGPSRIGFMTRQLLESEPREIYAEFAEGGSFAATYDCQGTDRGLVGGLLGYAPENPLMKRSLDMARERGISVHFAISQFESPHPNTVRLRVQGGNGEIVTSEGISTGGGIIEILKVNGFPVSMAGDFYELLIIMHKSEYKDGVTLDQVKNSVKEYEYIDTAEHEDRILINVKTTYEVDEKRISVIREILPALQIMQIRPVLPILSRRDCRVPFRTAGEMEECAEVEGYTAGEAGIHYEVCRADLPLEEVMEKMIGIVDVMEASIHDALAVRYNGRLIKSRSADYLKAAEEGRLVDTGAMDTVVAWTMAMVETNSCYGTIVAAPTAGACGTVPGAVLGTGEYMGASKEEKAKALFAAGAVGLTIAEQATFAAEVCGCQAECGAASAMAAAGIVQLMKGSLEQSNGAASIALQNVLGMICDSVANLVEVPCLGRNVMCAVNAVSSANMVLAGVEPVIPLDEVIVSMLEVGKLMPPELCCTNAGGLAVTRTSLELSNKIKK